MGSSLRHPSRTTPSATKQASASCVIAVRGKSGSSSPKPSARNVAIQSASATRGSSPTGKNQVVNVFDALVATSRAS